jgi:glycine/serine hydroxymethyltransferase
MMENEMKEIGRWISLVLKSPGDSKTKEKIRQEIKEMLNDFPLYPDLVY